MEDVQEDLEVSWVFWKSSTKMSADLLEEFVTFLSVEMISGLINFNVRLLGE